MSRPYQPPRQIPLDFGFRTARGREDFLIAPCNESAVAWIDRWPDWPAPMLIISGPAASGKTHLAAVWQERAKAVAIDPEWLLAEPADAIAARGTHLLFDGIDLWLGDRAAESTLFHLYNIFREEKRTLLVTMRMTPTQVDFAIADLASRWRAAPLAAIAPPSDDLLGALMVKQFHDRQLSVGDEVIAYALPRMERSFAAVAQIVAAADSLALEEKKPVTIALMRRVLSQL